MNPIYKVSHQYGAYHVDLSKIIKISPIYDRYNKNVEGYSIDCQLRDTPIYYSSFDIYQRFGRETEKDWPSIIEGIKVEMERLILYWTEYRLWENSR